MKRPSRGLRPSVATTRQIGLLRAPTRVSLSLTAKSKPFFEGSWKGYGSRGLPAAPHQLLHRGHLALLERAHHLLHLAELLDQLVHGLHAGAGARRDALAARPVDDLRAPPLLVRHGGHDRLDAVQLALVDLRVL